MTALGLGIEDIALFVGFGLLIGVLFGFFGMGGSFLVTPVLLVVGYPATVAIGSGLAFVFGTSIISALSHRVHGQIDYPLAILMTLGMMLGIEIGKTGIFLLEAIGQAELAISIAYIGLLGSIGHFVLWDAHTDGSLTEFDGVAAPFRTITLPPMVTVAGGNLVSVWVILVMGLSIGVLSGCLGVGGGFLLIPAMVYGLGIPAAIAVGTSTLQIAISGGFGTYVYALSTAVEVPVVTALLIGSALGARIGAGATRLVDEADLLGYFGVVSITGSVAMASKLASTVYGLDFLGTTSIVLICGAMLAISGAIIHASIASLAAHRTEDRSWGH